MLSHAYLCQYESLFPDNQPPVALRAGRRINSMTSDKYVYSVSKHPTAVYCSEHSLQEEQVDCIDSTKAVHHHTITPSLRQQA